MNNPKDRIRLMESCMDGINKEVVRITDRIRHIESILDEWEKTREPMIFTDADIALVSSMDSDAEMMERRVEELKKDKEALENEMPGLRN